MKHEIASVYVIEHGDRVKVGSSWEPEVRWRKQIRVGKLVHATPQHARGRRVEAVAHQLLVLAGLRVKNEWFVTDRGTAIDAIVKATKIVDGVVPPPAGVRIDATSRRRTISVQISHDVAAAAAAWVKARQPNMSMSLAVELGLVMLMDGA